MKIQYPFLLFRQAESNKKNTILQIIETVESNVQVRNRPVLQLNYIKIENRFRKVHQKMDHSSTQSDNNDSDASNHLISYSRLADQIDREDEQNQKILNSQGANLDAPPANRENANSRPENLVLEESEEQHQSIDEPEIIIHYSCNNKQRITDKQPDNAKMLNINPNLNKAMVSSQPLRIKLEMRPMVSSKLGPIIQNESENKRSDEEVADQQQTILESNIYNHVKINSMHTMKNTNNINFPSNNLMQTGCKGLMQNQFNDCNIRAVENSVELLENEEKVVTVKEKIEQQNHIKSSKTNRPNQQLDKKILSSLTTASKLIPKKVQQKPEEVDEKKQQEYRVILDRISKVEATLISINEKKKITSQNNPQPTNFQSNRAVCESSFIKKASKINLNGRQHLTQSSRSLIKRQTSPSSYEIISRELKMNKQLEKLINQQVWIRLLSIESVCTTQSYRILAKVANLFDLEEEFRIYSKEPFTVQFVKGLVLIISYSKKIYFGQCKNERGYFIKNGYGVEIDPLRSIYRGNFQNGVKEGKGSIVILGKYSYDGSWRSGVIEGKGMLQISNKSIYTGQFINGKKHGFGIEDFQSGDRYQGYFQNNAFHGKGTLQRYSGLYSWRNGAKYKGTFMNDELHGQGKWISAKGDQYNGNFTNSKKEGWGVYSWRTGRQYEGQFENGSRKHIGMTKYSTQFNQCDRSFMQKSISPKRYKIYFNN